MTRPGFTKIPHALVDEARQELEPAQLGLLIGLITDAQWECSSVAVAGVRIDLAVGEVLIGQRNLAARWGMTRDQVRRFLDRLRILGWISTREAAPPPAPLLAPRAAPRAAPPPTIVRFERWRENIWSATEAAPPPAPLLAPLPAHDPPQYKTKDVKTLKTESLAPAAPSPAATADFALQPQPPVKKRTKAPPATPQQEADRKRVRDTWDAGASARGDKAGAWLKAANTMVVQLLAVAGSGDEAVAHLGRYLARFDADPFHGRRGLSFAEASSAACITAVRTARTPASAHKQPNLNDPARWTGPDDFSPNTGATNG